MSLHCLARTLKVFDFHSTGRLRPTIIFIIIPREHFRTVGRTTTDPYDTVDLWSSSKIEGHIWKYARNRSSSLQSFFYPFLPESGRDNINVSKLPWILKNRTISIFWQTTQKQRCKYLYNAVLFKPTSNQLGSNRPNAETSTQVYNELMTFLAMSRISWQRRYFICSKTRQEFCESFVCQQIKKIDCRKKRKFSLILTLARAIPKICLNRWLCGTGESR